MSLFPSRTRVARPASAPVAASAPNPAPAFGFPIFLEVRGRRVFVAGGGRETPAKAAALADLGALVTVWLPAAASPAAFDGSRALMFLGGAFSPRLLHGAIIAIVGTGDRLLDHRIALAARARGVLVNTVDDIDYCDWSAPAILRRGDLLVAIGTGGIAPALAVRMRDQIADEYGPEYGELLTLFAPLRRRIGGSGRPFRDRRTLWYQLVDGPAIDHLRAGRRDEAERALTAHVDAWLRAGAEAS